MNPQPIISLKINCKRIEKERLFVGEKGTYLNATLIPLKTPDQFGNTHMICQDVSKEERAQNIKGPIIGNAKVLERKPTSPTPTPRPKPAAPQPRADGASGVPF